YTVYARTDQLIAGLEHAVDPNDDGDAHDAARIALLGVGVPFSGFADGPEARAVDGAAALDTLVVTASGNDGAAGPTFGSIAGRGRSRQRPARPGRVDPGGPGARAPLGPPRGCERRRVARPPGGRGEPAARRGRSLLLARARLRRAVEAGAAGAGRRAAHVGR